MFKFVLFSDVDVSDILNGDVSAETTCDPVLEIISNPGGWNIELSSKVMGSIILNFNI